MSTNRWKLMILYTVCLQFVSFILADDLVVLSTPSAAEQEETTSIQPSPTLQGPEVYSLHVYSDVKYRYATTVVTSRVANPADKAQQIHFSVILPETAFISGFLMMVDEIVYKAYVKEKEEAKKEFAQAVEQGISAAHIEKNVRDSNQFTVSVNVEPYDKVDFNLTYEQLLTRSLGVYSNVININPGQIVRDMSVNVKINESTEIIKLEVPALQANNEIDADNNEKDKNELANIGKIDSNVVIVRWAPTQEQQKKITKDGVNGQLVVKYDVNREKNPQQILVDEGYFVHFFAPESLETLRKHTVFVLDYSGSMAGRKVDQLREAMQTILSDLHDTDYFSLVLFSNIAAAWYPKANISDFPLHYSFNKPEASEVTSTSVVPATEANKKLAIDFLKELDDYSATNIIDGLRKGIQLTNIGRELLRNETVRPEPLIIFLTDGQANVDIDVPEEIVKEVKKLNVNKVTIYSLGFGYGADIKFLRKLSLINNGFARKIYEASDAALQLKNFYKEVASPLLANITFNYLPEQVDNETSSRINFPSYFDGSELVVVGKLHEPQEEQKDEAVNVGELVATTSTGKESYPIIIHNPCYSHPVATQKEPSHLEKVWAYLTIQQLLDDYTVNESNNTKKKALDLALQYSFVTPLTSLVVVKPNSTSAVDVEAVQPGGNRPDFILNSLAVQHPAPVGIVPQNALLQPVLEAAIDTLDSQPDPLPTMLPVSSTSFVPPVPQNSSLTTGKLNFDDISWLKNYVSADGSKVIFQLDENTSKEYKLGRNETDTAHGTCNINGETRSCRHLEHCVLDVFKDDFDKLLPIMCHIPYGYVGVCCPY